MNRILLYCVTRVESDLVLEGAEMSYFYWIIWLISKLRIIYMDELKLLFFSFNYYFGLRDKSVAKVWRLHLYIVEYYDCYFTVNSGRILALRFMEWVYYNNIFTISLQLKMKSEDTIKTAIEIDDTNKTMLIKNNKITIINRNECHH